jgi:7,8-dihydropterin-6-yl-methyl-4-(beta-D-ribofuranosyl)aminobenzene 5'-phosphate synthase
MSSASSSKLKITIVYDNYLYDSRLETAWGFASVIQGLNKSILFDTGGNGSILLSNMHQMKINPAEIDVVVISHIHHDHVGGLSEFLKVNPNVAVYLPKSFPESVKTMVRESGAQPIEVNKEIEICENCYSNGELGTTIKEQSLIMKSDKGLIIITGCAHPGIVNIVKKARDRFKDDVFLALGGFHLSGLTENQLDQVIKEIKLQGVEMIGPCHCSGDTARRLLEEEYGTNYLPAGVGMQLDLEMVT